ncbi:MAG: GAF domain-containing protein [Chloroflexi bacterium]|nr:GAF domain-containing protein [Chloroflexota bacterium]MCC6893837.1 GAF domain-containing protein [Anaerolineae bacterium]
MSSFAPKQSQNSDVAASPISPNTNAVAILNRLPFYLTITVSLVAVILLFVFLSSAIQWRQKPFFGAMMNPYLAVDGSQPIGSSEWAGLNAGLQRLDEITHINGQRLFDTLGDHLSARTNFLTIMSGLAVGDTVEVQFQRPDLGKVPPSYCSTVRDGFSTCSLSYMLGDLSDTDFIAYFIIPFIGGLILVILGIAVAYLRPQQPAAQLVSLFSLTFGVFMAGLFSLNNTYTALLPWLLATLVIGAPLGTLALVFPVRLNAVYRYPWLKWLPLAFNMPITLFGVSLFLSSSVGKSFPDVWQPGLFYGVLMLIVLTVNLVQRRAKATSPTIRDQTNSVLIGIALMVVPLFIWIIDEVLRNLFNTPIFGVNTSATMPFFVMPSLALAYAVLQYRRVNTDQIISQGITYGIMLVALVLGYFLIVFGASLFTNQVLALQGNQFVIALTIFVLAVAFLPIRNVMQERINRIYFRKRTNYQEHVEDFAARLTSLETLDQLFEAFRNELAQTINPSSSFLFLPNRQAAEFSAYGSPKPETDVRFDSSSSLIKLLDKNEQVYLEPGRAWQPDLLAEKSRLGILKTVVLTPMRGRRELIGFVALGAARNTKGGYGFEELRFIQSLTAQLAVAVERAQVVDSLERRVRELDVLSQVSQAVNFTISFDDLLELIYAQTDRLISAPYFYIALRERGIDKMFFAFFLENDERYTDRENRRWLMGRDLFSEVVNTGKPLRVENYAAEMQKRGSTIIYESLDLKAWMGVPLEAGSSTLGVLAVGSTEVGKKYTDDQLRVFSDIGTLAATSLEKARLFAETDLRARQLSALNEISQKLSSELNVENLLELITESAANILNAEAGSLLLTDENSDSLEFRVATGESGKKLIGRKFPKNRGLAGEVATTGKTVIVNDAANDPRWGGEATGAFSTTAVLAVPLLAQGKVIGVLEVLNKKEGGVYLPDDAELLTTFAGQAAVAIENARLFQMTDLQLGQRVAELQALERIDVELNRSLDLQKVADITMRYAISNSGATAGALGLVVGDDNPHLEIISMSGYDLEDYPQGAEGRIWPLEGVVKRVMRTRQPDLVTDTKIDPNYTPSLRGSLSQLTIPMLAGGAINAILVLEKDKEPRLSLVDMAFAQRLAEHASIAITNAQINAELTRANESKSEFVSFVAHELKTPMTSMKGFADLLVSGMAGEMNDNQKNFLNTIRSNIDRMNTLVSDLNDVTKLQTNNLSVELAPIDFRTVVSETLRPLTRQIEEKEQLLTLRLPERLPNILADQNRLIQVMTNMVSNAWKYSPENTEIVIAAEVQAKTLDNKGRDQGASLHVSVKDGGIGMSPEDLAKLFTPYFRSENPLTREQPGTGLGLTITRGIIQQHKGEVWVESELGKGTTFHFTIPIAVESQPAAQPEMQPAK